MKISKAALCSIYAILPICLAIMLIDTLLLHGTIRKALPILPESLFLYAIVWNDPHIVASFFSFYDKEYFSRYWKKILVPLILFSALVCVPTYFGGVNGSYFMGVVLLIWTIEHVIGQQFGLTRMMTRAPSKNFLFWKLSGLFIGMSLYAGVYIHGFFHESRFDRYIEISSLILFVPFVACSWSIHRQCRDPWGVRYLWLNCSMIVFPFVAYLMGYMFFVVFMPRVIHDVTAFMFYSTHDRNRNVDSARNILYRPFQRFGISIAVLCPLLAILYAFPTTYILYMGIPSMYHVSPMRASAINDVLINIGLITAFLHFYTDSFIWKQGSLHRQHIAIA